MIRRFFDGLNRWSGTVALFLVVTGGTAMAVDGSLPGQNTVGTADIINGEVKVGDVGQGAVATDEIANNQVKAGDIGDGEVKAADIAADQVGSAEIGGGAVKTSEIANGEVGADDLSPGVKPGASGARAWGVVNADGTIARSKNVAGVTNHPTQNGIYCVDPAAGIDASTAMMIVGLEWSRSSTSQDLDNTTHAEWLESPDFCPGGTMEVLTYLVDGAAPTFGEIDSGGFDLVKQDQAFTFVIP